MLVYIFLLLSIPSIYFVINLSRYNDENRKRIALFLYSIVLFFFYFLKDLSVGADYIAYVNFFLYELPEDFSFLIDPDYYGFEKGFTLLNLLISLFNRDIIFFNFIFAILLTVLPIYFVYKYSSYFWISIFLFFSLGIYTNSFSLIRQTLAVYICWLSIPYIVERKILKFMLIVLLAFSIHKTALIFIPLYFVYRYKLDFKYVITMFAFTAVIFVLISPLMQMLTFYLQLNDYTDLDVSGGFTFLLFLVLIFIISYIFIDTNNNDYIKLFMHMLFLGLLMQILATRFNIITRLIDYYKISLLIVIPHIINNFAWGKYRALIIFISIILFTAFFYLTNKGDVQHIIPYKLIEI